MSKAAVPDEIQVLRFFEQGPIEKVEVVFNIVAEKMRERLGGRGGEAPAPARETGAAPKRRPKAASGAPAEQPAPQDTPPA